MRRCFKSNLGIYGLDPGGISPSPDTPEAARIKRAYKLREQPVEARGALTAPGSFLGQSTVCRQHLEHVIWQDTSAI
jgi:hypothetical protein